MGRSLHDGLLNYDRAGLPPGPATPPPTSAAETADAQKLARDSADAMAAQRRADEDRLRLEGATREWKAPIGPPAPAPPLPAPARPPLIDQVRDAYGESDPAATLGWAKAAPDARTNSPEEQTQINAQIPVPFGGTKVGPGPAPAVPYAATPAPAAAAPAAPATPPPSLHAQVIGGGGGPSNFTKLLEQQKGEDLATYRRQHALGLEQQQLARSHVAGETIYRDQRADAADKQAGALQGQEAEYRAAVDDFKKDKIDEDHFWKNRSAGQKAAGFLAAALGGALQGFNHLASNPALDQMNHALDRDISVQRANHEDKREAASAQKGLYSMMLDRFHNANAASEMAHAGYLDVIRAKGDEMAAKQGDEGARDAWMHQRQLIDREEQAARQRAAAAYAAQNSLERALALKKEGLGIEQQVAGIKHTDAETEKLHGEAAAGPKLTDQQKAQQEQDAFVGNVERDKGRTKELTRGTSLGAAAAERLPGFVPGVQGARAAVNDRNHFNNTIKAGVAAAYKLSTDANEPKNLAIIESYAAPYELNAGDTPESARAKMDNFQKLIADSGRAKGTVATPPPRKSLHESVLTSGAADNDNAFPGFKKGTAR